jgi:hypothetical protein
MRRLLASARVAKPSRDELHISWEKSMKIRARLLKRVAVLAIAGALAAAATASPSFARNRGAAIAAGIAAGAIIGAATAAAASDPYYGAPDYYGAPYAYDVAPVYVVPGSAYGYAAPAYVGSGYWANTNSAGPNRARMENSN